MLNLRYSSQSVGGGYTVSGGSLKSSGPSDIFFSSSLQILVILGLNLRPSEPYVKTGATSQVGCSFFVSFLLWWSCFLIHAVLQVLPWQPFFNKKGPGLCMLCFFQMRGLASETAQIVHDCRCSCARAANRGPSFLHLKQVGLLSAAIGCNSSYRVIAVSHWSIESDRVVWQCCDCCGPPFYDCYSNCWCL